MKLKKIAATLSLIAIVGSSITAAATTHYLDTGIWKEWITGWGAGWVYSEYVDWDHDWYTASVRNAYGKYVIDRQYDHDTYAEASVDAIAFGPDHSYYDYGNWIYK